VFNPKQEMLDLFKFCEYSVATDGSEDLLIHYPEPNQPYETGLDRFKGLYYVVFQERQDPPFSTSAEGLTQI